MGGAGDRFGDWGTDVVFVYWLAHGGAASRFQKKKKKGSAHRTSEQNVCGIEKKISRSLAPRWCSSIRWGRRWAWAGNHPGWRQPRGSGGWVVDKIRSTMVGRFIRCARAIYHDNVRREKGGGIELKIETLGLNVISICRIISSFREFYCVDRLWKL